MKCLRFDTALLITASLSLAGLIGTSSLAVNVEELSCLSDCNPEYPNHLVQQNIQGSSVIRFVLNLSGKPMSVRLAESSGNSELDNAAIEAVKKMRFTPPPRRRLQRARLRITFIRR